MKKAFTILTLLLVLILNFQTFITADAQVRTNVDIKINDQYISLGNTPFIHNSVTYVPLRSFSEAISAQVFWNSETKSASVIKDETKIAVYPNKKNAILNNDTVSMNSSALIYNDRLYVPVRFISDCFGGTTRWDSFLKNACLTFKGVSVPKKMINKSYTDDDILWLGRIIEAESAGEPISGKTAVGNVVLNRVKNNNFPNTIYGVIFDRNYGVQFQPIINGTIYNTPGSDSISAAKYALKGSKPVGECLYFLNPKTAQSHWIINNRTYHTTIKNHDFYL